ncbi:MAG TPA: SAM-dependent methyltransferase [Bacteroidales bacterium]|nr:SAM-dependent methyltransferase [Bacteroidales bacterium]HPS16554.1 SAM-dependent methyltransferase [Bacteroidales bacterium]
MTSKGTLFLIPSVIAENTANAALPPENLHIINSLEHFIVEEERTARRFLKSIGYNKPIDQIKFHLLNEHTSSDDFLELLKPLIDGTNMGLLSEAGCPCIADPGSAIVSICHSYDIKTKPLIGPSSILLAMMASGMNGQNFAFNGYFPVDKHSRSKKIKEFEIKARRENQAQIFIEAPYRNMQLLNDILKICSPETLLCIATEITSDKEYIKTKTISEWKNKLPEINKKTTIFIIGN